MSEFILYVGNKNISSWSLRAYLMLKQTGVKFQEELIPLYVPGSKQNIVQYSPSGKVPALRHNHLLIWDSLAIGEYLAEIFPEARLWPNHRNQRAQARSISAEMHSGFQALRQHLSMKQYIIIK